LTNSEPDLQLNDLRDLLLNERYERVFNIPGVDTRDYTLRLHQNYLKLSRRYRQYSNLISSLNFAKSVLLTESENQRELRLQRLAASRDVPSKWPPIQLTGSETTIGQQLRVERQRREMALAEVFEQTRVTLYFLKAIENENFDLLPGGFYNHSFIKAYARCVGLDEKEAVEAYTRLMRIQGNSAKELHVSRHNVHGYKPSGSHRRTILLALFILAILALCALAQCSGRLAALTNFY
jgi:hypothetical protein